MVKELIHDPILLAIKSEDATIEDVNYANDLLETLIFHQQVKYKTLTSLSVLVILPCLNLSVWTGKLHLWLICNF